MLQETSSGPAETVTYVTTDDLGSVSEALSSSGTVTAQQLYGPYGNVRYSSGTMPTARGYTGQYTDAATGLDYYSARYYDPLAQQFISADSVLPGQGYDPWGLSRYAYVAGNPETAADPTGHRCTVDTCGGGGGGSTKGCKTCSSAPGNGGEGSTNGDPCISQPMICREIRATFHDINLQHVMMLLLDTDIGQKLLGFLLQAGEAVGSSYVTWANLGSCAVSCEAGYTNGAGFIQLNTAFKDDPAAAATVLVHEAVESYYAIEDGIRTFASQQMDYVAQWFAGEFEVQSNKAGVGQPYKPTNDGHFGAYGLSFDQVKS
jgi:RHS repeat-associated protein